MGTTPAQGLLDLAQLVKVHMAGFSECLAKATAVAQAFEPCAGSGDIPQLPVGGSVNTELLGELSALPVP